MTYELVKGARDYTDEDAVKKAEMKKIIVGTFEKYGFEPADTPIIEYESFVVGDNTQDEAISDIFRLKDRGKRELALRYEFTFQLKRLMRNRKLPYRRYQIGEVFRDEPVGSNRFRQFTQCDVDVVGSTIKDEAEILALTSEVLTNLGIKSTILINNRKLLNEILDEQKVKEKDKEQVLREIDKLDKLPEKQVSANLKKLGAEGIIKALKKGETYFSKFPSYNEILELMQYCKYYGVKVSFSPTIVRGLSYYKGSVFEVKAQGVKETIIGGGSYIFDGVSCTGISFGIERLFPLVKLDIDKSQSLIVSLGEDKEAIKLCQKLREQGKSVFVFFGKPTKALEYANSKKIKEVIFVGKEEVSKGKYKIKDMKSGKESYIKL
jgi:histidyl-tRNA synthetase